MKKLLYSIFLAILSISVLSACGQSNSAASEMDKFVIAYLPQETDTQIQKTYKDFEKQLSEELGVPVEAYQANSYNAAIEAMKNQKADLALFGQFSYIVASDRANAEAIAGISIPELEGQPSSVIIVPKDSDIQSIADLKGKTMGFVDPVSTSGHLLPKATIVKELGIEPELLEKDGDFFKSTQFAGKHDNTIIGVVRGQYEAAGTSPMMPKMLEEKGIIEKGSYRVIAEADPIPVAPMAVRGDLPDDMKAKVQTFILSYDNPDYFKSIIGSENGKFVKIQDTDYDVIRDISKSLNLSPEQLLEN
jgi:phosphonate transport system substrate-binding protein